MEFQLSTMETLCMNLLKEIQKCKLELQGKKPLKGEPLLHTDRNSIISYLVLNKDIKLDIEYTGLKNSGWRKNCDYIKTFDKYVHIKHEGQNKTLSISKIESIVPSSPDMHKAIKNYELFHKMEPGTAKPMNVYKSSAGVEGWANYEIKIDEDNINEILTLKMDDFNLGTDSSKKLKRGLEE